MFAAVHGGRNFHRGIRATKEKFDERFPGNAIPVRIIAELISECKDYFLSRLSGFTLFLLLGISHLDSMR
jgi:hypothetical protein